MKTLTVTLIGKSPYQQGRYHETAKLEKEGHDDYEKRTWREKSHCDAKGQVYIPPQSVKNCLAETAKYLGMQIKGKGKATYTKHFQAGVLVVEPSLLYEPKTNGNGEFVGFGKPITKDAMECMGVFGDAGGKRGGASGGGSGSRRVMKFFPTAMQWATRVQVLVLDETITEDVLLEHLEQAGKFVGLGVFRPINGGYYGRFAYVDGQGEHKMLWQ